MHTSCEPLTGFPTCLSTVVEIQRDVVGRGKQGGSSRASAKRMNLRLLRQDINRILHIFNVRSVGSTLQLLITSLLDGAIDE